MKLHSMLKALLFISHSYLWLPFSDFSLLTSPSNGRSLFYLYCGSSAQRKQLNSTLFQETNIPVCFIPSDWISS